MNELAKRPQLHRSRNRRGESMIMVIVMLMVFMTLGGAVLTTSATATAAASARVLERQEYYYARSVLGVLDDSMRTGALGKALCQEMMNRLVAANTKTVRFSGIDAIELTYAAMLNGAPLTDVTISDVTVRCEGRATAGSVAYGAAIDKAMLLMRSVEVNCDVTYREQTMKLRIRYRCTGGVENYRTDPVWTMNWVVQQVG